MDALRIIAGCAILTVMGWWFFTNYHATIELQICDKETWEAGCEQRRHTIP